MVLIMQMVNAQYFPYLKNFEAQEYKAGNQNWDVKKSEDGRVYFGNNNGLLEFDGINWNLWKLPNGTAVRTVFIKGKRIYVGTYEDFGYFERNLKGDLEYFSLFKKLKVKDVDKNEAYWQILEYKNAIVFRSFLDVWIYKNNELKRFDLGSTLMSCNVVDNKLLIATLDKGIYIYKNNQFQPYFNSTTLKNTKIVSITLYGKNQILINTELKGSFLFKNNSLKYWKSEISEVLKKYQLNRFSNLASGKMVFGTIKNGVYVTDKYGKILYNINKQAGLLNNTILGQFISNNKLWLSLDNGIAFIDLKTKNFFFNDKSGKLGAVYDVINYKNKIYIGSNTGLYYINKDNKIEFVKGSQGQVWNLKEINGDLFCGHNNGTYLVENSKLKLVSSVTGGWVIKKVPEHKKTFLQGAYAGFVRYKKEQGKWNVKYLDKSKIPVRYLEFEDENTAWAAHANKGLYKIKFNKNVDSIKSIISYDSKKGLLSNYFVHIHKIANTIVFQTNKGWQKYEPLLDSIIPYNELSNKFSKHSNLISEDNIKAYFFKIGHTILYAPTLNTNETISIPGEYFSNRLIKGNEIISKLSDSTYALNLYNGFMVINAKYFKKNKIVTKPELVELKLNNKDLDLDIKEIKLPFRQNRFSLIVASPKFHVHHFEYKLNNSFVSEKWKNFDDGFLEFSNLSDGDYNLNIRSVSFNNAKSKSLLIKFTVLSPWYKSLPGYLLYFFLIVLLGSIIYYLNKKKIRKQQDLLKISYENNQKKLLNEQSKKSEQELITLKNETLKNELKLKSKELANSAMALAKKNEMLLDLKNQLIEQKESFSNKYSFNKIIKKIDYSVEHEDEWRVFEHNFNQIHEEYFNKLKANYPNLTKRDLRICAFLKMNLSTKEIVPLLNISIRGIETQRYRLKRKLNLKKEDSLRGFLQKIN